MAVRQCIKEEKFAFRDKEKEKKNKRKKENYRPTVHQRDPSKSKGSCCDHKNVDAAAFSMTKGTAGGLQRFKKRSLFNKESKARRYKGTFSKHLCTGIKIL